MVFAVQMLWSFVQDCCYHIGLKVEVVLCSCAETAVHFSTIVSIRSQSSDAFKIFKLRYLKNVYWSEMCCESWLCL